MANKSCYKLWESEFDNIVSTKNKIQYIIINQLKLKVNDTFEKKMKK